jgi:hypothetical protein
MPRLITADVIAESSAKGTVQVRFATTRALLTAADTAVLLIIDRSGSEFGIRLERGRVTDVHLWDAGRLLRQGLPTRNVTMSDGLVCCDIPKEVLPRVSSAAGLSAALVVNGALVQSGFPVTLSTPAALDASRPIVENHAREGQIHG